MSKSKNDGGPAFPAPNYVELGNPLNGIKGAIESAGGMSLRDWFAGRAAVALIEAATAEDFDDCKTAQERAERIARSAYNVADAMLAEREKQTPCTTP